MNQEVDPLLALASRFYAAHAAILQLGTRAPAYLKNDYSMLGEKIAAAGGKITEGLNVFNEKGPVVRDKEGNVLSYDLGRTMSEQFIVDALVALDNDEI